MRASYSPLSRWIAPGPDRAHADPEVTGELGLRARSEGPHLLVPHADPLDPVLPTDRVGHGVERVPDDPPDLAHAVVGQGVDDQVGDGALAHGSPQARNVSGSASSQSAPPAARGAVEQLARGEVVEHVGVAEHPLVVDAAAEHARPQLVGAGQAHRGQHLPGLRHCLPLVVEDPLGLVADVEGAHPLGVLRRNAHGTGVGVTGLGLDAADGHHHRPRGVRVVGALHHPLDDVDAGRDLAARTDLDPVTQADADEGVVHRHQSLGQRRTDVVLVLQRRRARAALATVDHDEVGRHPLGEHRLADGEEVDARAEAQLEAGRLAAGELAHPGHEQDQLTRRREHPVVRRGHALLAGRNAASIGDLAGDLGSGQHAADAGLGSLAELERDHLDLVVGGRVAELAGVEVAVLGPGAEVAAADLPDQVAALAVVLAEPALAGVVGEPAEPGPRVERRDRVGTQRAEAHRGDVHQRHRVGLGAVRSADRHAGLGIGHVDRFRRVHQVLVAGFVHVTLGAERLLLLEPLGALVDR